MDLTEKEQEQFCYYPFYQLLFQPTGNISPCCYKQDLVLGNLSQQNLDEIWNGPIIRQIRKEFLENKPVLCKKQMNEIGCHHHSRRLFLDQVDLKEIQTKAPLRFDVRLNGRCNLQCVMCSVWKEPNGVYNDTDFWKRGKSEFFPFIKELDVLGGEPFVQQDTYKLIKEVVSVNPSCEWAFVTNGQYKFSDVIIHHLNLIKIRWIQVSLDSINPETYSKIRVKGTLEKTLSTLDQLILYQKFRMLRGSAFQLTVSMCVQIQNWEEIEPFLNYAIKRNIRPILQFAFGPDEFSLLTFSRQKRKKIYENLLKMLPTYGIEMLFPLIEPLRYSLYSGEALTRSGQNLFEAHRSTKAPLLNKE